MKTRLKEDRAEMELHKGIWQDDMGRKRSWRFKNKEAGGVTIEELEDRESIILGEIGCVSVGIGGDLNIYLNWQSRSTKPNYIRTGQN